MIDLNKYPVSLQLLMKTDGTVTELIKLLSGEGIQVSKISEEIETINEKRMLDRCIFLQGKDSKKNWLYAQSKITLDHLPDQFVIDLLEKNIPIGTLWINYRVETFKLLIDRYEEVLDKDIGKGFAKGDTVLTRVYQVFNQQNVIMEITEKFPINKYQKID